MKILFVNPPITQCGVHQYGKRLFDALDQYGRNAYRLVGPSVPSDLQVAEACYHPDLFIFNWHPGINLCDWYHTYGRARNAVAIYHDGDLDETAWRGVLFSDPTKQNQGKWYSIGRPLPDWSASGEYRVFNRNSRPIIGINGFVGAWAPLGVIVVMQQCAEALIRLHLPYAVYGDGDGGQARHAAAECKRIAARKPGIVFEVSHDFMSPTELSLWLSQNDLNLYVRNLPPHWRGVSSVLDYALAARRPIAVNSNVAFRHVHGLNPSIQIEHLPLRTIMENGIAPLEPLLDAWSPAKVAEGVELQLANILETPLPKG